MSLTPQDIHHKEFRSARFGGYNEEEVDSFLDLVADEFEKIIHETADAAQQLEVLRGRVAEFEDMQSSLQTALLAATRSAEAIGEQARLESEATVNKAQEEADSLIRGAQEQARRIMLRAQNEGQRLDRDFTRLRDIKRRYIESLRAIALGHLREVEDLEAREDAEPVIEPPVRPPVTVEAATGPPADSSSVTVDRDQESTVEAGWSTSGDQVAEAAPAPAPAPVEAVREPAPAAENVETVEESAVVAQPEPAVEPEGEAGDAAPRLPAAATEIVPEGQAVPPVQAQERPEPSMSHEETAKEPPGPREEVPSSSLVDEVLKLEDEEDPYAGYTGVEGDVGEAEKVGRRSGREKRDKHFFWE